MIFDMIAKCFIQQGIMCNRLILCVLFLFSLAETQAQQESDSISVSEVKLETVVESYTVPIMYYFNQQNYDSAAIVLNAWENDFGMSEPIMRTRILLAISENNFSEDLYDSTIVDHVLNYMFRMETSDSSGLYESFDSYFGYVPIRGEFDYFTQSIADSLLALTFYNPIELYFVELYANVLQDAIKEVSFDTTYSETKFREYYYNRVDRYRFKPDFNMSVFTGIWMPYGSASLLGNHPLIGIQGGIRSGKMTYTLGTSIKFLKSKNEYNIVRNSAVESSSYFFGFSVCGSVEATLIKLRNHELGILAGIGVEMLETVKTNTEDDNTDNDESHTLTSLTSNIGANYRYYFKEKLYLGLRADYNFVNFKNIGGTRMAGNCFTLTLQLGGLFNEQKQYYLRDLRYTELY